MSTPARSFKEQLEAAQKAAQLQDAEAAKLAFEMEWKKQAETRSPLVVPNAPRKGLRTRAESSRALNDQLDSMIRKGRNILLSEAAKHAVESQWKAQEDKGLPQIAPNAPKRGLRSRSESSRLLNEDLNGMIAKGIALRMS